MKKPHNIETWVVVADGERARFLKKQGTFKKLVPVSVGSLEHENPPTRAQGADRPGRTHESAGGGTTGMRHAMAPRVDWHEFEKTKFARAVGEIINKAASNNAFDRLIIIAPPETLGNLRPILNKSATVALTLEIGKDLTHLDTPEIADYLTAFLDRSLRETD